VLTRTVQRVCGALLLAGLGTLTLWAAWAGTCRTVGVAVGAWACFIGERALRIGGALWSERGIGRGAG